MFKTRQQIADEYGINRKTLYRKLKKYGIALPSQGLLTPEQQQAIYARLGTPGQYGAEGLGPPTNRKIP